MNVRLTPRRSPSRTLLFTGVTPPLLAEDGHLILREVAHPQAVPLAIPLADVAEIALDEDGGGDEW
jgi:hypothetical protein